MRKRAQRPLLKSARLTFNGSRHTGGVRIVSKSPLVLALLLALVLAACSGDDDGANPGNRSDAVGDKFVITADFSEFGASAPDPTQFSVTVAEITYSDVPRAQGVVDGDTFAIGDTCEQLVKDVPEVGECTEYVAGEPAYGVPVDAGNLDQFGQVVLDLPSTDVLVTVGGVSAVADGGCELSGSQISSAGSSGLTVVVDRSCE